MWTRNSAVWLSRKGGASSGVVRQELRQAGRYSMEDVVRITQDNDIAVACAVGGTSSVTYYKLNVKDKVKVSLLAQSDCETDRVILLGYCALNEI